MSGSVPRISDARPPPQAANAHTGQNRSTERYTRKICRIPSSHGPSRMVDIADAKGVKSQSLVKVIKELESIDYVRRFADHSDSRAKLIELTSSGKQHMIFLSEATEGVWQQYVDDLGLEKTQNIFASLRFLTASK